MTRSYELFLQGLDVCVVVSNLVNFWVLRWPPLLIRRPILEVSLVFGYSLVNPWEWLLVGSAPLSLVLRLVVRKLLAGLTRRVLWCKGVLVGGKMGLASVEVLEEEVEFLRSPGVVNDNSR